MKKIRVSVLVIIILSLLGLGNVFAQDNPDDPADPIDLTGYSYSFYPLQGDTVFLLPQQNLWYNIALGQNEWTPNITAIQLATSVYTNNENEFFSYPNFHWNHPNNGYAEIAGASYYLSHEYENQWIYQILLTENWLSYHWFGTMSYQNNQPIGNQLNISEWATVVDSNLVTHEFGNSKTIISNDGIRGDVSGDGIVDSVDLEFIIPYQQISNTGDWYTDQGLNYARASVLFGSHVGLAEVSALNIWIADSLNPITSRVGFGETFGLFIPFEPESTTHIINEDQLTVITDGNIVGITTFLPDGTVWYRSTFVTNGEITMTIPDPSLEYKIEAIQTNSTLAINGEHNALPNKCQLNQNYPNPFNPSTTISYYLPLNGPVELTIFSITGQAIMILVNDDQESGDHSVIVNLGQKNLSSGIYLYRLTTPNSQITRKLSYVK